MMQTLEQNQLGPVKQMALMLTKGLRAKKVMQLRSGGHSDPQPPSSALAVVSSRFHIKEGIEQIEEDRAGHVKQAHAWQGVLTGMGDAHQMGQVMLYITGFPSTPFSTLHCKKEVCYEIPTRVRC